MNVMNIPQVMNIPPTRITLPSLEVPATCPVAMVTMSGWMAKLKKETGSEAEKAKAFLMVAQGIEFGLHPLNKTNRYGPTWPF